MSRIRNVRKILYRCLDCNNDFVIENKRDKSVRCPRCQSNYLWGKPVR